MALERKLRGVVAISHVQHRFKLGVREDSNLSFRRSNEYLLATPAEGDLIRLYRLLMRSQGSLLRRR